MPGEDAIAQGVTGAAVPAPSVAELLTVAADVAAMVEGRTAYVTVSTHTSSVSVHVDAPGDAEHLARLLGLGHVDYHDASDPDRPGCVVWTGGRWPGVEFSVLCTSDAMARPVRAFPERAAAFDEPVPFLLGKNVRNPRKQVAA
ncbi:hypothetical protein [Myceligenerans xiligouense]|uniref:NADH-quinone oxidoreductase subunit C n=1 Tax=Myceligenerans xiligouense TaxID=253184 RepID=A0A3N4YVJ4_9MICO|nr:hypothetical protein [Myceligenerans xiligouense]RPF23424.1 hypothetical protein EDD34_4111 [Myceligenerans xiligouense]